MHGDYDASMNEEGYGCETDWWSLGAVIYELAVGVAPFFASDIKQTYSLIVDHEVRPDDVFTNCTRPRVLVPLTILGSVRNSHSILLLI